MSKDKLLKAIEDKYKKLGVPLDAMLEGLLWSTPITYWDYIQTDALLGLQIPRTDQPDEMVFIMYHQVNELLFKMILWEIDQVAKIFNKAKDESTGYEPYAKQIAEIFRDNINVLEEVINILFYIAEADGHVSDDEETMIANIAYIFGLSQKQYQSIKESRKTSDKLNPYIVLESQPTDDLKTIRKNYIKLSKEHHPDLLISKGVPVEVINESKNKMRSINAAWDQVQKLKSS